MITFATVREALRARAVLALSLALVFFAVAGGHARAACTLPNQLTNGQTADATQVMANFNSVTGCINAGPTITGSPAAGQNAVFSGASSLTAAAVTKGTLDPYNGLVGYIANLTDNSLYAFELPEI